MADGSAGDARDAVVVRLAQPPEGGHAGLDEVVLGEVGDALLGEDHVRLVLQDRVHRRLDPVLLSLEKRLPVALVGDLHVGLRLPLLVLEGAVEEDNARVLDLPSHLRVRDVLVNHDALEHAALLHLPARDLLHLGVPLDVHLTAAIRVRDDDRHHGLHRQVHHELPEARGVLGPDARRDHVGQLLVVVDVHREGHFLAESHG
mmetsp:Transcript_40509/g.95941  ORF Transcript_40509/g.95941 Transcript_40509/m.95941 type:complete len:203 (-) Transcript_40509:402-1010(-)